MHKETQTKRIAKYFLRMSERKQECLYDGNVKTTANDQIAHCSLHLFFDPIFSYMHFDLIKTQDHDFIVI